MADWIFADSGNPCNPFEDRVKDWREFESKYYVYSERWETFIGEIMLYETDVVKFTAEPIEFVFSSEPLEKLPEA